MATTKTGPQSVRLTPEQAERAIVPGAKVHTFVMCAGWAGADIDRTRIIAAIAREGGAEITNEAAVFEHRIAVTMRGIRTFVETNPVTIELFLEQASTVPKPARRSVGKADQPTSAQIEALRGFAQRHGRNWKSKLKAAWAYGKYERHPDAYLLRQMRNTYGPKWLTRFSLTRFPAQAGERNV